MNCTRRNLLLGLATGLNVATVQADSKDSDIRTSRGFPGGIVQLSWRKQSSELPMVKFGLRETVVLDAGSRWRALIGLNLNTLPGDYVAYIKPGKSDEPAYPIRFEVVQKRYPMVEQASLPDHFPATILPLSNLDFKNSVPPALPWRLPIDTQWNDEFGQIVVVKGRQETAMQQNFLLFSPSTLSSGMSFVVQAPQNGIVSRIVPNKTGLSSSMTVCIDHGRGLFSILHGIEDLTVETGNGVVAGAVIGVLKSSQPNTNTASKTVTNLSPSLTTSKADNLSAGQGLIWQSVLNGAYINPLMLTQIQ